MATERWIIPKYIVHTENDGAAFLRDSGETEVEMGWGDICRNYPSTAKKYLEELEEIYLRVNKSV